MKILQNVSMKDFTTVHAGGHAAYFCVPDKPEDLAEALDFARQRGIEVFVAGRGSNLIVRDGGFDGIIISLRRPIEEARVTGDIIVASAGQSLMALARLAAENNLCGMEWSVGIPASLGGAIAMNAGAYGGQIADVVREVVVWSRDGAPRVVTAMQCAFGYRSSVFGADDVIVSATLQLTVGVREQIRTRMHELRVKRCTTQPVSFACAGSTFKRAGDVSAGELIDRCGLKGRRVGGAEISHRHANFFVNIGGATANDFEQLIELAEQAVLEQTGVALEREIIFIGKLA